MYKKMLINFKFPKRDLCVNIYRFQTKGFDPTVIYE